MTTNPIGIPVDRPWGNYQTLTLSETYQVKLITVHPGGRLSLQKHAKRAEHWTVVKGLATITVGDTVQDCGVDESIYIAVADVHRLENFTEEDVQIIEVQVGSYLGEDDIVRLEDVYDRLAE